MFKHVLGVVQQPLNVDLVDASVLKVDAGKRDFFAELVPPRFVSCTVDPPLVDKSIVEDALASLKIL